VFQEGVFIKVIYIKDLISSVVREIGLFNNFGDLFLVADGHDVDPFHALFGDILYLVELIFVFSFLNLSCWLWYMIRDSSGR
jgi:hypothetical protein